MFRPVTKYSAMVTTPESMAQHLRRALAPGAHGPARAGPPERPRRPLGEAARRGVVRPARRTGPRRSTFDRVAVRRAASLLLGAKHPVILAGAGVGSAGAEEHLRALAELLPARVATTPRGKGVFPEDHPLALGVLGFAGHAAARETLLGDDVDVLFTVGASLNETATLNWDAEAAAEPDVPPARHRRRPHRSELPGRRRARRRRADHPRRDSSTTSIARIREGDRARIDLGPGAGSRSRALPTPELRDSDRVPVTPQRWRCDLEEVLPPTPSCSPTSAGTCCSTSTTCACAQQRFVLNLGFGSMGHGTVAPIGAALAGPDGRSFAIVGDGCFTMNGMELLTAVEYDVPVVWIVENNNMHGITWHASRALSSGGALLRSLPAAARGRGDRPRDGPRRVGRRSSRSDADGASARPSTRPGRRSSRSASTRASRRRSAIA